MTENKLGNKAEAKKHIGERVYVWTALNGEYLCLLKEVITFSRSPWRGKVEVLSVVAYPVTGLSSGRSGIKERKPFAEGQVIDVGGSSIKLIDQSEEILPYKEGVANAINADIKALQETIENYKGIGKNYGLLLHWLNVLQERRKEL